MSKVGLYAKAIGGALAAAGTAAITALQDGHINTLEWVAIASAFVAAAAAIAAVPEFPVSVAKYYKAITSGLVAGLGSLSTILVSGHAFTSADWINIAIAIFVGTGLVHVTKNAAESETIHPASKLTPATGLENSAIVVSDDDAIDEDVPDDIGDDDLEEEPVEDNFTPVDEDIDNNVADAGDDEAAPPAPQADWKGQLETK
jgi:hypothetical protein